MKARAQHEKAPTRLIRSPRSGRPTSIAIPANERDNMQHHIQLLLNTELPVLCAGFHTRLLGGGEVCGALP